MIKHICYTLGGVLVLVGVLGFFMDPIFGIFDVDVLHNVVHLATGLALILLGSVGGAGASMGIKIIAVVYGLVALLGFVLPGDSLLGLMEVNGADDILHVALAALLLYLGFFHREHPPMPLGTGGVR